MSPPPFPEPAPACPLPWGDSDCVLLAHGEGARQTRRLVRDLFFRAFGNQALLRAGDSAVLPQPGGRLALTTDSFVVSPLFFPGGDIGALAVHGTVNDLAVVGATPQYLTAGFILEEGLPLATLRAVVGSMADAAAAVGVQIVAGDTKVVPRGAVDGLFINTSGVGILPDGLDLGVHHIQPGDRVLVSGTLGDHGLAVLAARAELELHGDLRSDSAPLADLIAPLLSLGPDLRFLRDPTRGGLAAVMHEIAAATDLGIVIEESVLPVSPAVRGAAAILGLDPMLVANEGKLVAVVAASAVEPALAMLRAHPLGRHAAAIGAVTEQAGEVLVRGALGTLRVLDEPQGAPLPRIC